MLLKAEISTFTSGADIKDAVGAFVHEHESATRVAPLGKRADKAVSSQGMVSLLGALTQANKTPAL
jgi:hypothetical protein